MRKIDLLNRLKGVSKFGTPKADGSTTEVASSEENATIDDVIEFAFDSKAMTRMTADKIAAFNNGVSLISDTIASLSCYLYKRCENGDRHKVNDYRNRLLNCENSANSTSFNMKKNLVEDYLIYGNGRLDIHRNYDYTIKSLIHIPHADIRLNDSTEINKRNTVYSYDYWGMSNVPTCDVVDLVRKPKDGELQGVGVLKEASIVLSNSSGFEEYTSATLSNGFFAKAVIEKEGILAPVTKGSIQKMLKKFFSGKKNSGKVMILDDGMKLKTIALSPADLELLQQKDFSIKDIARMLKLQPSMLGIATGGMTYSNEKDNQLLFLKNCIQPILTLIEETLNKYLLTEAEKIEGYFFEFNTQSMLKMSPQDEVKMWGEAVKGIGMTKNEARRKMNWHSIEGLDRPQIDLNQGIVSEDGTILSHKNNNLKGGEIDE